MSIFWNIFRSFFLSLKHCESQLVTFISGVLEQLQRRAIGYFNQWKNVFHSFNSVCVGGPIHKWLNIRKLIIHLLIPTNQRWTLDWGHLCQNFKTMTYIFSAIRINVTMFSIKKVTSYLFCAKNLKQKFWSKMPISILFLWKVIHWCILNLEL